jgi:hypothetical protein
MSEINRGEMLWEVCRSGVRLLENSELVEMVAEAWQAAGARYDVDVVGDYCWLMGEFHLESWPKHLPWERLVEWLAEHIDDFLGIE